MNIILFDGECYLCHKVLRFIIKHDSNAEFHFASLQSGTGQQLSGAAIPTTAGNLSTVVYIENGKYYTQSTAILRIMKKMGGFWQLTYVFIIIPPFVRDFFYKVVSATRHRIFGKNASCKLPSAEIQKRLMNRIL